MSSGTAVCAKGTAARDREKCAAQEKPLGMLKKREQPIPTHLIQAERAMGSRASGTKCRCRRSHLAGARARLQRSLPTRRQSPYNP